MSIKLLMNDTPHLLARKVEEGGLQEHAIPVRANPSFLLAAVRNITQGHGSSDSPLEVIVQSFDQADL